MTVRSFGDDVVREEWGVLRKFGEPKDFVREVFLTFSDEITDPLDKFHAP